MSLVANWSYPTAIRMGNGRLSELGEACAQAGITKPLFVTDRGLASLEITKQALGVLRASGLTPRVFAEVDPNPTDTNLSAGVEAFQAGDHDGVVAFGGGSALDLGKLIAFMSGQTRPVWDFEDIGDWWTRADPEGIAPNVAVPTTAGTGSEVGRAGVVTNSAEHVKKVIFHPKMLPSVVLADPALTVGMPKAITAGTGLDAFAHCLEAYCSPVYHPMSAGIALEGMRLVHEYLEQAYDNPGDIEARTHMMSAAMMGAVAFQKGLGAIHALSHPIGARYGTHHGTTNAIVMPAVLRFNRPAVETRLASAADYLGIGSGFDGFYDRVMELRTALAIPNSLADVGVKPADVPELAKMAIEDPTAGGNPLPLTVSAAEDLYHACF